MLGDDELSQTDEHFRDNLLFHEYFHGETGRGLGASHQTGWTGCIALMLAGPGSPWNGLGEGRMPNGKLRPAEP